MDWKNIINKDWTLFLDRDGVINVRIIDGYVTKIEEFEFLPNVIEALKIFKEKFDKVFAIELGLSSDTYLADEISELEELIEDYEFVEHFINSIYFIIFLKIYY